MKGISFCTERNTIVGNRWFRVWRAVFYHRSIRRRLENKQATELSVTIRSVLLRETYPLISVHGPPSIRFTPRGRLTELRHSVTGDAKFESSVARLYTLLLHRSRWTTLEWRES